MSSVANITSWLLIITSCLLIIGGIVVVIYVSYIYDNFQISAAENNKTIPLITLSYIIYGGSIVIFLFIGLYGALKKKLPFIFIVLSFFVAVHLVQTLELVVIMDIFKGHCYYTLKPMEKTLNTIKCVNLFVINHVLDANPAITNSTDEKLKTMIINSQYQSEKQPEQNGYDEKYTEDIHEAMDLLIIGQEKLKTIYHPFLALEWLGILSALIYTVQYWNLQWQNKRLKKSKCVHHCRHQTTAV